jgi:hypothetical protein
MSAISADTVAVGLTGTRKFKGSGVGADAFTTDTRSLHICVMVISARQHSDAIATRTK